MKPHQTLILKTLIGLGCIGVEFVHFIKILGLVISLPFMFIYFLFNPKTR